MLKVETNTSINEKISIITEIKKGLDEIIEKVSLVKHTRLTATFLFMTAWLYYFTNSNQLGLITLKFLNSNMLLYKLLWCWIFVLPFYFCFILGFKDITIWLFSKVKKAEITLVIFVFVFLDILISLLGAEIITIFGVETNKNAGLQGIDWFSIYDLIISLIGEQLYFFTCLFFAFKTFKRLKIKNLIVLLLSISISCVLFGLGHLPAYDNNILQCLLLIGLPFTLIQTTAFLLTKNLIVCYAIHLIYDLVCVLMIVLY